MGTLLRDLTQGTPEITVVSRVMGRASDAELRGAFKLFDIDGDGVITIDELKSLISKVGGDMSEADAAALIHGKDKDGNTGIDFSEFAKLWEALHGDGEAEIRKQFAKLDTDGSGFITKEEMAAIITDGFAGDKVPWKMMFQLEEAKAAIDMLDVDKDGKVSYPEFMMVMFFKYYNKIK